MMTRKYLTTPELEAIANESDFFDDMDDENVSGNEKQVLKDDPSDYESLYSIDSDEDNNNTSDILQARDGTICSEIEPRLSKRFSKNILRESLAELLAVRTLQLQQKIFIHLFLMK